MSHCQSEPITHHAHAESLKYQATRDNELATYNEAIDGPDKAEACITEFMKENFGRSRKRLINWGQFKRSYGIKVSNKESENSIECDRADFTDLMATRGMARDDPMISNLEVVITNLEVAIRSAILSL